MSGAKNEPALGPIVAGALINGLGGAVLGGLVGASTWTSADNSSGILASMGLGFIGAFVGGLLALGVGFLAAWNGGMVGCQPDRQGQAPGWGLVSGAMLGFFIGPVLGGLVGTLVQQITAGIYLGLFLGPIVGLVGWQIGYWGCDFLTPDEPAHGH
jgi:uncharacterized membrane protein YeaQ/YmgE (transglycosylase-associated protein family)